MLVKDYALRQLHWILQKDPWIEAVMTAGGVTLDALADRIVAIYNAENFDELPIELTLKFIGDVGVPANIQDLKSAIIRAVPAHIYVNYAYRYLLIREVHEVMTLAELNATPLSSFAGGT